jgi:hypothetical protein
MVDVSVKEPSSVVTVIVTTPAAIEVTKPLAFTVAIASSDDAQVIFLLVALFGLIVAVSCCVFPKPTIVAVSGVTETLVTLTGLTVSVASPKTPDPSVAVALMTEVPAKPVLFAVTNPEELTVAIEVLEEDQVTSLMVASAGRTVSVA